MRFMTLLFFRYSNRYAVDLIRSLFFRSHFHWHFSRPGSRCYLSSSFWLFLRCHRPPASIHRLVVVTSAFLHLRPSHSLLFPSRRLLSRFISIFISVISVLAVSFVAFVLTLPTLPSTSHLDASVVFRSLSSHSDLPYFIHVFHDSPLFPLFQSFCRRSHQIPVFRFAFSPVFRSSRLSLLFVFVILTIPISLYSVVILPSSLTALPMLFAVPRYLSVVYAIATAISSIS
jgi:hypothetical protein